MKRIINHAAVRNSVRKYGPRWWPSLELIASWMDTRAIHAGRR